MRHAADKGFAVQLVINAVTNPAAEFAGAEFGAAVTALLDDRE